MSLSISKSRLAPAIFALSIPALTMFSAQATIVEFQTSQGNFKVNLHDNTTPKTVENFLKYVTDQDYNNTVIHRSVTNFVVQGGGYSFDGTSSLSAIDTNAPVVNEPVYSNIRGTIAMAKVSGNANSATSQWFFNLQDNSAGSAQLDLQNGGFTVFGEVVVTDDENGMTIINKIAALAKCGDIPVTDNSSAVCESPSAEHFVTIESVSIVDDSTTSDASLSSVKNTLINQQTDGTDNNSSGGGGSFAWLSLALLGLAGVARKLRK